MTESFHRHSECVWRRMKKVLYVSLTWTLTVPGAEHCGTIGQDGYRWCSLWCKIRAESHWMSAEQAQFCSQLAALQPGSAQIAWQVPLQSVDEGSFESFWATVVRSRRKVSSSFKCSRPDIDLFSSFVMMPFVLKGSTTILCILVYRPPKSIYCYA